MSSVIDQVVQDAAGKTPEPAHARQQLHTIQRKIVGLRDKRQELIGFESPLASRMDEELAQLEKRKAELKDYANGPSLPCLDFNALRLRNHWQYKHSRSGRYYDLPLPQIGLFDVDSPICQFRMTEKVFPWRRYVKGTTPELPPVLARCYNDVFNVMLQIAKKEQPTGIKVSIQGGCSGLIPEPTRKKIKEAETQFERVFIATEMKPENWELKVTPAPVIKYHDPDPLVLGFDGKNLWIIDQFDLTPTEQYIKDEFSV